MSLTAEQSSGQQSGPRFPLGKYIFTPWTVALFCLAAVAVFDLPNFPGIADRAVGAFLNTAPYIAFAVMLIAALKATGSEAVIARAFQGRETQMIVLASLFGGLAPFCSCEVIPFIAGLLAAGAPLSAVMAFWLSSPLVDPPTLLITAGALGWPFAIGKAVSAVAVGLIGGFAVKVMISCGLFPDPLRPVSSGGCGCRPSPFRGTPVWHFWTEEKRRGVFRDEFITNALFLTKWLILAYVLEALMIEYIPANLIASAVGGDGIVPIATAALVGMPAYLNGYVAPPMLAGLIEQGMSPGAAMAFMVAGAVSSIPAMAAVWALVKPGVFGTYITLGLAGALISGLAFNLIV